MFGLGSAYASTHRLSHKYIYIGRVSGAALKLLQHKVLIRANDIHHSVINN